MGSNKEAKGSPNVFFFSGDKSNSLIRNEETKHNIRFAMLNYIVYLNVKSYIDFKKRIYKDYEYSPNSWMRAFKLIFNTYYYVVSNGSSKNLFEALNIENKGFLMTKYGPLSLNMKELVESENPNEFFKINYEKLEFTGAISDVGKKILDYEVEKGISFKNIFLINNQGGFTEVYKAIESSENEIKKQTKDLFHLYDREEYLKLSVYFNENIGDKLTHKSGSLMPVLL